MLSFFRILCLLLVALVCIKSPKAANENNLRILLFGDSLISGYELMNEDSLAFQLQKYFDNKNLNVHIIDAGVSGDTTSGGRSRFNWTLEKENPDIIFISLGGNDLLRGVNPSVIRENLEFILNSAQEKQITVILSLTEAPKKIGGKYAEDFNLVFKELAEKYNAVKYPFLLNVITDKETQMLADGIHPNPEGVKVIVQDLAPKLENFISNKK